MRNVSIARDVVNLALLDQELRMALGEKVYGASFDGRTVTVHLRDDATESNIATVRNIVSVHDASGKTEEQLAVEARDAAIVQLRVADVGAIVRAVEAARTIEELRAQAVKLAQLVEDLVRAQDFRLSTELGPPQSG